MNTCEEATGRLLSRECDRAGEKRDVNEPGWA
jgi:hypothetical protein